jgi:hypothetical protein
VLTLAGGFASTLSWPATQFLIQTVGWARCLPGLRGIAGGPGRSAACFCAAASV